MKKILTTIAALLMLMFLVLFAISRTSKAYAVGRTDVARSAELTERLGPVRYVFLLSFGQKTGPTGKGCTSLFLFVVGERRSEFLSLRLRATSYRSNWEVVDAAAECSDR